MYGNHHSRDPSLEQMAVQVIQQQDPQYSGYSDPRMRTQRRLPSNQLQYQQQQQHQYQQQHKPQYQSQYQQFSQPQQPQQPQQQRYVQQNYTPQYVQVPRFVRSSEPPSPTRAKSPVQGSLKQSTSSTKIQPEVQNASSNELVFEDNKENKKYNGYNLFRKTSKTANSTGAQVAADSKGKKVYQHVNASDDSLDLMPTIARGFENSISKTLQRTNGELRITGDGYYITEEINPMMAPLPHQLDPYYNEPYYDPQKYYHNLQQPQPQRPQLQSQRSQPQIQLQRPVQPPQAPQAPQPLQPRIHEAYLNDPNESRDKYEEEALENETVESQRLPQSTSLQQSPSQTQLRQSHSNDKRVLSGSSTVLNDADTRNIDVADKASVKETIGQAEGVHVKGDVTESNDSRKKKKGGFMNVFKFDKKKKEKKEKSPKDLEHLDAKEKGVSDEKEKGGSDDDGTLGETTSVPPQLQSNPIRYESSQESMRSIKSIMTMPMRRRKAEQVSAVSRGIPQSSSHNSPQRSLYDSRNNQSHEKVEQAEDEGEDEEQDESDSNSDEEEYEEGSLVGLTNNIPIISTIFRFIDDSTSLSQQAKLLIKMFVIFMIVYEVQSVLEIFSGWFSFKN